MKKTLHQWLVHFFFPFPFPFSRFHFQFLFHFRFLAAFPYAGFTHIHTYIHIHTHAHCSLASLELTQAIARPKYLRQHPQNIYWSFMVSVYQTSTHISAITCHIQWDFLHDQTPSLWRTLSFVVVPFILLSSQTKQALEPGVVPV